MADKKDNFGSHNPESDSVDIAFAAIVLSEELQAPAHGSGPVGAVAQGSAPNAAAGFDLDAAIEEEVDSLNQLPKCDWIDDEELLTCVFTRNAARFGALPVDKNSIMRTRLEDPVIMAAFVKDFTEIADQMTETERSKPSFVVFFGPDIELGNYSVDQILTALSNETPLIRRELAMELIKYGNMYDVLKMDQRLGAEEAQEVKDARYAAGKKKLLTFFKQVTRDRIPLSNLNETLSDTFQQMVNRVVQDSLEASNVAAVPAVQAETPENNQPPAARPQPARQPGAAAPAAF